MTPFTTSPDKLVQAAQFIVEAYRPAEPLFSIFDPVKGGDTEITPTSKHIPLAVDLKVGGWASSVVSLKELKKNDRWATRKFTFSSDEIQSLENLTPGESIVMKKVRFYRLTEEQTKKVLTHIVAVQKDPSVSGIKLNWLFKHFKVEAPRKVSFGDNANVKLRQNF